MNITKVLFDLDGTLFDSQRLHAEVEVIIMQDQGKNITAEALTSQYAGRPTELVFQEAIGCDAATAMLLTKRKWQQIMPRAKEALPLCNLEELFRELKDRGIDIAIGTASPSDWAWSLIEANCLDHLFDHQSVICGDMVNKGKPDPEIWIAAAGDHSHFNCLVVEDGLAGIEGAIAAQIPRALLLPKRHPQAISINNIIEILQFV